MEKRGKQTKILKMRGGGGKLDQGVNASKKKRGEGELEPPYELCTQIFAKGIALRLRSMCDTDEKV